MNRIFLSVIIALSVIPFGRVEAQEVNAEPVDMRQQMTEHWKTYTKPMFLQQGALETDIPMPGDINKAPRDLHKMSAEDFRKREGQEFPIDTIRYSGPSAINMVLVGDGFTSNQYDQFKTYAQDCVDYMFRMTPYNNYKEWFNVYFIKVDSRESGTSHPGYPSGTCPEGSPLPISHYDTYFGVELDAFGIHRLPCVTNNKIYELLNALVPGYDIAGVLANTKEYGGSGGDILVTTVNEQSNEIFMHELGHTFGKVLDEYYAGDGYLRESPNTSKYYTQETSPWGVWWGQSGVGAFKIGGSALGNTYYKPVNGTCKMEYLGKAFCPVCREQLIKQIHNHVNMIASYEPNSVTVKPEYEESTVEFNVHIYDIPRKKEITWLLDDEVVATGSTTFSLDVTGFIVNERHKLEVKVMDNSTYLKEPMGGSKTWYVRRMESAAIAEVTADAAEVAVETIDGGLSIATPAYRQVIIFGMDGKRVMSRHISGKENISLPSGVYVVEGKKVIVR